MCLGLGRRICPLPHSDIVVLRSVTVVDGTCAWRERLVDVAVVNAMVFLLSLSSLPLFPTLSNHMLSTPPILHVVENDLVYSITKDSYHAFQSVKLVCLVFATDPGPTGGQLGRRTAKPAALLPNVNPHHHPSLLSQPLTRPEKYIGVPIMAGLGETKVDG